MFSDSFRRTAFVCFSVGWWKFGACGVIKIARVAAVSVEEEINFHDIFYGPPNGR